MCVCVLFEFRKFVCFLLWELVYVFQSFVSIFAHKKSDRTRCLAVSILDYNLGLCPKYNISWNSKSAERAKAFFFLKEERNSVVIHR